MSHKIEDSLSPLTQSHVLMNKAQAALWLNQAGFNHDEVVAIVGFPTEEK